MRHLISQADSTFSSFFTPFIHTISYPWNADTLNFFCFLQALLTPQPLSISSLRLQVSLQHLRHNPVIALTQLWTLFTCLSSQLNWKFLGSDCLYFCTPNTLYST